MKVKNIMFSGFAAAILMGVVAEANAAPVAVASKGYVDSIAGTLSELETTDKNNLVGAINEVKGAIPTNVQGEIEDGTYTTTTGFFNKVTQTDGKVVAEGKDFDQEINADTGTHNDTAPTTKAVYTAIEGVRGAIPTDVQGEIEDGTYTTTTGFFNKVTQTDGKVVAEGKDFDQEINADTGTHNDTAPTTKAVYTAIEGVRSAIPTDVQGEIADGTYTTDEGFFYKVEQTDGKVTAEERKFDTVVNATTGVNTDTAPTTKAVYEAIEGVRVDEGTNITIGADGSINTTFPKMPKLCSGEGVVCVLTSQNGELAWTILTKPVDGTIIDGGAAQTQSLPNPVFAQPQ